MTLPESLARKALGPCTATKRLARITGYQADAECRDAWSLPAAQCESCQRRPAVEAVLREMVEACAELADENPFNGYGDKYIARNIRALLTEEETP